LPVAMPDHLDRRPDVYALLRLGGHLLHHTLDAQLERGNHVDAQDMHNAAEQHLTPSGVDDDVVVLRSIQEGRLDNREVLTGFDIEPLEERRLLRLPSKLRAPRVYLEHHRNGNRSWQQESEPNRRCCGNPRQNGGGSNGPRYLLEAGISLT